MQVSTGSSLVLKHYDIVCTFLQGQHSNTIALCAGFYRVSIGCQTLQRCVQVSTGSSLVVKHYDVVCRFLQGQHSDTMALCAGFYSVSTSCHTLE